MTALLRTTAVLLTCLLLQARAGAEQRASDFWGNIVDPGRKEFEGAIDRGSKLLEQAKGMRAEPLRTRVLQDALAAFRAATRHSPNNYRGWFLVAKVLMELDRVKPSIAAFKRVRKLGVHDREVSYETSFQLGIAYSKVGAFEEAVLEYDHADQATLRRQRLQKSTVHGNAAEALMALGRLDEAIQRYRESLGHYPSNTLVRFGLAVAYDRDEQISKARQEMRTALATDSAMRQLTSPNVFFIPEGDIHYYFALGYETKGDIEQAKSHWQLFLQKLPDSHWAPRARAHLAGLGVAPQSQTRRPGRLAPVPKPLGGQEEASARDRAAVRSRLYGYLYRIRSCYKNELRKQPTLAGELRVAFVVKPNGRADNIRVVRSTLRRPSLHRCVIQNIAHISFSRPISARPVRIEYPMKFQP